MSSETEPKPDVLQSKHTSSLSAEEIAKAVARHKKHHSAAKEENLAAKAKKGAKK